MRDTNLLHLALHRPAALTLADAPAIRQMNLSGFIYAQLPAEHPLKAALRPDALMLVTRHTVIRQELRELLQVWNTEGIPLMLTKGFALAEFEYASPTERFYGDVDAVLPHDLTVVMRAVHLALARGWHTDARHASPHLWTHEMACLFSPSGHTRIDLHRYVVAWTTGSQKRVAEMTDAVWQGSRVHDWDGIQIRRPSPTDQAVVTLALARTWGEDAGGLKTADYSDLQVLSQRYGLGPVDLLTRAKQLGGLHTCQAFLKVCSPWTGTFALGSPDTKTTLLRGALLDGRSKSMELWLARFIAIPSRLFWMPRVLPDIVAAHKVKKETEADALKQWTAHLSKSITPENRATLLGAINWWLRLLHPLDTLTQLSDLRAYAVYRALQRFGGHVQFVRGQHGDQTRAWLEDHHDVPNWYGGPLIRQHYRETFRWPQPSKG